MPIKTQNTKAELCCIMLKCVFRYQSVRKGDSMTVVVYLQFNVANIQKHFQKIRTYIFPVIWEKFSWQYKQIKTLREWVMLSLLPANFDNFWKNVWIFFLEIYWKKIVSFQQRMKTYFFINFCMIIENFFNHKLQVKPLSNLSILQLCIFL